MLCDLCAGLDERFKNLYDICEFLTIYGVQPRYPNELEIIEEDAKRALRYMKDIFIFYETHDLADWLTE